MHTIILEVETGDAAMPKCIAFIKGRSTAAKTTVFSNAAVDISFCAHRCTVGFCPFFVNYFMFTQGLGVRFAA